MLQVCLQQSWPQDKPIAQIVFPQILPSSFGNLATLWVMLGKQDIQHSLYSKPYRQFLFMESPYPMLLWVTALHTQEHGCRWLPCYLDLKDPNSQEIIQNLAQTGYYRILLFSTEEPQRCEQVITVTLSPEQCQNLQEWTKISQTLPSTGQSRLTKHLLKTELEKLKAQMLVKVDLKELALPLAL